MTGMDENYKSYEISLSGIYKNAITFMSTSISQGKNNIYLIDLIPCYRIKLFNIVFPILL